MTKARKLTVFDFNDDPADGFENAYGYYLEVITVDTWFKAQQILSESWNAQRVPGFDVALVDVSFAGDPTVQDAEWQWLVADMSLYLIGPILALPFMSARTVTTLVPYSAHWDVVKTTREGTLCTALGLLVAGVLGKPVDGQGLFSALERFKTATEPKQALIEGLRLYRDRLEQLIREERIGIDPGSLVMATAIDARIKGVTGRLCIDPDFEQQLHITVRSAGRKDTISLLSLFADEFRFRPAADDTVEVKALESLSDWLRGIGKFDGIYLLAEKVMTDLASHRNAERSGRTLLELAVRRVCRGLDDSVSAQVLRMVILFANVEAAHVNCEEGLPLKDQVHQILCLQNGTSDYRDLFGKRRSPEAPEVPKGQRHQDPERRKRTRIVATAFGSSNELYPAERDQVSALESTFCQKFAEEYLLWRDQRSWSKWFR